jgi:hypothetical protein
MAYKNKEDRRKAQREWYAKHADALCRHKQKYNQSDKAKKTLLAYKLKIRSQPELFKEKRMLYAANARARHAENRATVIQSLGGKCVKCGFADHRALQVDHINGGGTKEISSFRSMRSYYRHVVSSPPGTYQLLCANCNWIKKWERNENSTGRAIQEIPSQ